MMNDTCEIQETPSMMQRIRWSIQNLKWKILMTVESSALSVIRWTQRDSNYIKHADREFDIMYKDLSKEDINGPNTWMRQNVIALLAVLGTGGHSGGRIGYCLNVFKDLAEFKCISQLTGEDDEWLNYHEDKYQNIRMSNVFKDSKDGQAYISDFYVFEYDSGLCCTNKHSIKIIKFPYSSEKNVYIKVDIDGVPLTKRDRKLTGFKEPENKLTVE